ncbi:hypothetical protein C1646_668759 [Rhizophagus diaphanus]|nr:hypothetical protein C1646_668759 [Rhizophagus diaphanus] [Rhizophagus sp. MUCL 43196]
MPFECSQEVADNFEKLFESEEEYDVIIYAGENENVKELHVHSLVLRTRFIYCGKIDLEKLRGLDILEIFLAVDEIRIETLFKYIQGYLTKHQDEFLQQNLIEILEAVYQNELLSFLWDSYLEKICNEPEILFNSDKFITLKAPLLELFFKRDDLLLDEIVICRVSNLAKTFHTICDNKGATIVIVKISNSEQIVGGYNPLYRHSGNTFMTTYDSFIFSFANKNNFQTARIGYSNGANSVCGFACDGPAFGGNSGYHLATGRSGSIWFSDASINNTAFPKIGIPKNDFVVDDYEVFQVVKK